MRRSQLRVIDKKKFSRLLCPKSMVVFGGRSAQYAVEESKKMGFQGDIWIVHPTRTEISGLPCYLSIDDLPGIPDAAYVAVNANSAIEIVEQLNRAGCGGAVVYASGFAEFSVEGEIKQQRLVEVAGTMPIIGPNCYGLLNCIDGAVLWPDQHGCKILDKGVAVITQSGNIGLNITMQRRGLPLAFMFTMGNQANVSVADVIDALLDDPRITAIGLHIEAIADIGHFDLVCRRALDKKLPIVAAKSGRTDAAAKIAMSHTRSLTGSDKLFDALFERLGIARVETLEVLIETLKLLSIGGPLNGNNVASMSCSGGEAGVMADLIERHDLQFPVIAQRQQTMLRSTLNDFVTIDNPLDYHTFIWGDLAAKTATFSAMMSGGYDATMLLLDWPSFEGADYTSWDTAMHALIGAQHKTGHRAIILASLSECLPLHAVELCAAAGVAPMVGLDSCLAALAAAYQIGRKQRQPAPVALLISEPSQKKARNLDEFDSKQALAKFGLQIPASFVVTNSEQAVAKANLLGYPVVAKVLDANLVHKTDRGGVKLNLVCDSDVAAAVLSLSSISDQFLVEKMLVDVVAELIIGVFSDQQFGVSLVIGSGGVAVELLKDTKTLLLPTTESIVRSAILGLKLAPLLTGYRGRPAGDIDACVEAVMAVANYACNTKDQLIELDINTLLVAPAGQGAVAADAYVYTAA
jgi:acyl-CoA synthetase (NDP forming)